MLNDKKNRLKDLILVAGHAVYKKEKTGIENPEQDNDWVLHTFQIGEPPFYIEHIRRGIVLASHNPVGLLLFSGGRTRPEGGHWSEATTYYNIAKHYKWWIPDEIEEKRGLRTNIENRAITEEYARDSFENLLFGICRFWQITGHYPRNTTIVSWAFKRTRFELHREAIKFPENRFQFDGFNEPINITGAWKGEARALHDFAESRYGSGGSLGDKRKKRDPFNQGNPYRKSCTELREFFEFMDIPENGKKDFENKLPWCD